MVKSKIILAGFWAHAHCEESFSKQIIDNGIDVIPFKISKYFEGKWGKYLNAIPLPVGPMLKVNKDLLTFIHKHDVDYIFFWNCNHILPSTLKKIQEKNIKIVTYNNDDPYGSVIKNKKPLLHMFQFFWFLRNLKFSDIIFVYRPINIEEASKFSNSSAKIKLFKPYFIPVPEERTLTKADYEQEVVFIGHYEADNRLQDLEYLFENNIDLKIYGTGWQNRFSQYQDSIYPLYGDDYIRALRSSKICLCFLSKMNRDVYTRRCFEIPGLKRLLLCERTKEMLTLFEEDKEAVYFSDRYELLKKIEWLLANPSKIVEIAEAGYKRLLDDGHDIRSRSSEILKHL
tara:strand:- start:2035 stop:3063 length:1029 start_codon:yes stop_codon:yes gene_type:complete